ncbi:MAG: hypothetical protein ACFFDL_08955 [Promethearchaeota archaeon]
MKVKWKTFRNSLPYICTNCEEFSNMQREYCEQCGKKDSLRKTTREDYEKQTEKVEVESTKIEETYYKTGGHPRRGGEHPGRPKRMKKIYVVLICFGAILIIDVIGFFIILNRLNISIDQIGDHLPLFLMLFGFSLVALVILVIGILIAYHGGKIEQEILFGRP